MDRVLDKLLEPGVVWVVVPALAILSWAIINVIRALRGAPESAEVWQAQLDQLSARVEALERAQQGQRPAGADSHVVSSGRSG